MDVQLCITDQYLFFFFLVPLCVMLRTVHVLWFDKEFTSYNGSSVASCFFLKCVGLRQEFYHIISQCSIICCNNCTIFTCLKQCRHVVTDTVKYNLNNFVNIFTGRLRKWKFNNVPIVKKANIGKYVQSMTGW